MEKNGWALVVVCAATFMLLFDVTIVVVALTEHPIGPAPELQRRAAPAPAEPVGT